MSERRSFPKLPLKTLLKVVVTVGVLGVLFWKIPPSKFLPALEKLSWSGMAIGLLAYFSCQWLSAVRWLVIAKSMRIPGATLGRFYAYYLQGMFFGLFLPTAVGGDVGRAVLVSRRHGGTWSRAFLSILAERMTGLIGLLLFSTAGLMIVRPPQWAYYMPITGGITAAGLLFCYGFRFLERHPWCERLIRKFVLSGLDPSEDPGASWPGPGAVTSGIGVSLLFHAASVGLWWWLLSALGAGNTPYMLAAAVYGLGGLASMVPSIGGAGPREYAITYLLKSLGHVPETLALAFSIVWLALLLLAAVPGGIITLIQQMRPASNPPAPDNVH